MNIFTKINNDFYMPSVAFPSRPTKPRLLDKDKEDIEALRRYVSELIDYKAAMVKYGEDRAEYDRSAARARDIFESDLKSYLGFDGMTHKQHEIVYEWACKKADADNLYELAAAYEEICGYFVEIMSAGIESVKK